MIIDIHCHVWAEDWLPAKWWDELAEVIVHAVGRMGVEVTLDGARNQIMPSFWDPTGERLIESMDASGIDKTVILALDYGMSMGEAKISIEEQNRLLCELAQKYPDRLIAFASVDPRREGALDLFEKCISEWGAKGLKLHPTTGFYPNEGICYPLYERALKDDLPILSHTGAIVQPLRSKYAQPIYLDDVLVDFPELKIIAAHLGFGWWLELAYMASTKPNISMDCSGWQPAATEHYETFCRTLRAIIDQAGPDRVLFGTDGPAYRRDGSDKYFIDAIKSLPENAHGVTFSHEEVDAILGGNAARLLGLEA